jgi:hypothetical protein
MTKEQAREKHDAYFLLVKDRDGKLDSEYWAKEKIEELELQLARLRKIEERAKEIHGAVEDFWVNKKSDAEIHARLYEAFDMLGKVLIEE